MNELKKAIERVLAAKDEADKLGSCGECFLVEPVEHLREVYSAVKERL